MLTVGTRTTSWLIAALVAVSACSSQNTSPDDLENLLGTDAGRHQAALSRVQLETQRCMAESGFEYVPSVLSLVSDDFVSPIRSVLTLGNDVDYLNEHGYGLTTYALQIQKVFGNDPNAAIIQNLPASQASSYAATFDNCIVEAQESEGLNDFAGLSVRVQGQVAQLDQAILADERVTSATPAWTGCMAAGGYSYGSLAGPWYDWQETLAHELGGEEPEEHTHGPDTDAHEHDNQGPSDEDTRRLELAEIELAKADNSCRTETGLANILADVVDEYETEFVVEHRELLNEFADSKP